MEKERDDIMKKKAEKYMDDASFVHVTFQRGYWKRGYIKKVLEDSFVLYEDYEGHDMIIFFGEISDIQLKAPRRMR